MMTAVLFDFGGVVLSSPLEAFDAYEREQGLPAGVIRRINTTDPDDNAWARLERGQVDGDGFAELFRAEAAAQGVSIDPYAVLGLLVGEPRPVMVQALHRLSGAGFPLGLLTNNISPMPREGEFGEVLALFDSIVESSVEGIRKPEPAIYRRALERLGAAPDGCAYLDDLGANLKPARAMGMHTIKVADPRVALAELSEVTGIDLI
ncbi:MAG TPA: HAD-IA family hydrolase [Frankiaceae bacterium]|nr:HAD-IA family hydrolase [Frankiaceae bacterium]